MRFGRSAKVLAKYYRISDCACASSISNAPAHTASWRDHAAQELVLELCIPAGELLDSSQGSQYCQSHRKAGQRDARCALNLDQQRDPDTPAEDSRSVA